MQKHIKSVLEPIIESIYKAKTLDEGKKIMNELINGTEIKKEDKNKMLREVSNCHSLVKLQFYATNCMFKFEGLSVNSVIYK